MYIVARARCFAIQYVWRKGRIAITPIGRLNLPWRPGWRWSALWSRQLKCLHDKIQANIIDRAALYTLLCYLAKFLYNMYAQNILDWLCTYISTLLDCFIYCIYWLFAVFVLIYILLINMIVPNNNPLTLQLIWTED